MRSFDFFLVRKWLSSHLRKTSGRLEIEMELPYFENRWVTEDDGVRQDKIAICQKLIINLIKLVQYVNNQMR